ncbi:hypothetical protein LEP1GSC088_4541 [Leptospira interrogans str. L1207]|nr:hypothetical protein LEP1GSC088_4541 [Leptospira interrogans str. L1207]
MQIDSLNVGTTTIYKIKVYNNSICRIPVRELPQNLDLSVK